MALRSSRTNSAAQAGVGVVVGLGADAGDAEQGLQLLLEVAAMGVEVGVHPVDRHGRKSSSASGEAGRRPAPGHYYSSRSGGGATGRAPGKFGGPRDFPKGAGPFREGKLN